MTKQSEKIARDFLLKDIGQQKRSIEEYYEFLGPKQKEFVSSKGRSFVIMNGGARAGKTAAAKFCIPWAVKTVVPEKHGYGFIGSQSIKKGVEFFWDYLEELCNEVLDLKWSFQKTKNTIKAPNTTIVFFGMGDRKSSKIPFGFPIKWIFLEEPQTYNQIILKEFIEEVSQTRLMDFKPHSKIWMMCNPSEVPNAYITSLIKNPYTHSIHTTMHDNPMFKSEEFLKENGSIRALIEKNCKEIGITYEESKTYPPTARQIWGRSIADKDKRVFFPTEDNLYDELPSINVGKWKKVMGIDIGWNDANAIVVTYWNEDLGMAYVVYEDSFKQQDVSSLAEEAMKVKELYNTDIIVMDQGGAGAKNMAAEMQNRYGISGILKADKQDKKTYIKILQAEVNLRNVKFNRRFLMKKDIDEKGETGYKRNVKINKPSIFEEMPQVIWDDLHRNFDKKKGYNSDKVDALVYSYRYIHHHFKRKIPIKRPKLSYEDKLRLGLPVTHAGPPPLRAYQIRGFSENLQKRVGVDDF